MKHILFFGHRPYPNEHAVLETVFTQYLPDLGYTPIWILQPKTPEQSGTEASWNGTRVYVTYRQFWRGPLRHLELFFQYLRLGAKVLSQHEVDIIQARTGLPEALVAWWLAKRKQKPFVFQYSFAETDSREARVNQLRLSWFFRPIIWIQFALTRFIMQQACLTLAISEQMSDEWKARGIQRIKVFPLGAETSSDPEQIIPVETPPDTVIYFSSMHPTHEYRFLLDVFALVLQQHPTAHFLMVGDDSATDMRDYARQLNLIGAMTFTGRVPRKEVPRYIRAAVCSVAPFPPQPQFISVSSIKVVESLAMAVPVVGNCEIRDLQKSIGESGGGYTPRYNRVEFAESILKLLRNPDDAIRRGKLGREYVMAHRSYSILSKQLAHYYSEVLAENLVI